MGSKKKSFTKKIWVNSIFQMFTGYLPVLDNSRLYSLSQQSVAMSHSWSPSGKSHYDNISFFFFDFGNYLSRWLRFDFDWRPYNWQYVEQHSNSIGIRSRKSDSQGIPRRGTMSVYYGRRRIIVVRPSGIVAALPATSYKLGQVNGVTWGSWHTVSMSIYISVYNQLVPELIYTKLASKNKWSIYADSSLARTHALSRGYLISFFHFCEKKAYLLWRR